MHRGMQEIVGLIALKSEWFSMGHSFHLACGWPSPSGLSLCVCVCLCGCFIVVLLFSLEANQQTGKQPQL